MFNNVNSRFQCPCPFVSRFQLFSKELNPRVNLALGSMVLGAWAGMDIRFYPVQYIRPLHNQTPQKLGSVKCYRPPEPLYLREGCQELNSSASYSSWPSNAISALAMDVIRILSLPSISMTLHSWSFCSWLEPIRYYKSSLASENCIQRHAPW